MLARATAPQDLGTDLSTARTGASSWQSATALEPDSVLMLLTYVVAMRLLFMNRGMG